MSYATSRVNIGPDLCRHMVSLGHNELSYRYFQGASLVLLLWIHNRCPSSRELTLKGVDKIETDIWSER